MYGSTMALSLVCNLAVMPASAATQTEKITLSNLPAYSGEAYVELNNNLPSFKKSELTKKAFEKYSDLDDLGRCGAAYANVCKETMSPIEDMPPKKFNVYDDINDKLIAKGVPENEIAFIHDYDTPEQKQKLFNQMNAGDVRILLGSTSKCGAGMNAQKKMIALHHLDAPLRPSDVEQPKRNTEKHNQTSRNILNKYAQNQITNADFSQSAIKKY